MTSRAVRIVEGGKLIIPAKFRKELGLKIGDTVIVELTDGMLHVRSRNMAVSNAKRLMRQLVPNGGSVVDELILDRRTEAGRE